MGRKEGSTSFFEKKEAKNFYSLDGVCSEEILLAATLVALSFGGRLMSDWLYRLRDMAVDLPEDPAVFRFRYALRHGSMKVGLYAPRDFDRQEPHNQDELYIVVSGRGSFIKNGEAAAFGPHDMIFVEAGADHRFSDFSDDFAAWVIFWGPNGGEGKAPSL